MSRKKTPPCRHSHTTLTVRTLVSLKLRTSASFRAVAEISGILNEYLDVPLQQATHKTVLLWVKKIGYHALTRRKAVADDWVILLDHSIRLGSDKLFVILGIRECDIDFRRPLRYQDMDALWISSASRWNGEAVCDVLGKLEPALGKIKYAVGDYGSDIRKGLRMAGIPHVHDITHQIALILGKLYAEDEAYQEVTRRLARIRRQFAQTAAAHLLPPKQRKKSRYHNLQPLADYGQNILRYLDRSSGGARGEDAFREAMAWLPAYRGFFAELGEVGTLVREIERHVKHRGLSSATCEVCSRLSAKTITEKGRKLGAAVLLHMRTTRDITSAAESLLCTSDILESAFGKYKNYLSSNAMSGITDLALCIAAFTCPLTSQEIRDALENTTHADVDSWSRNFIGPTLLKKRRKAFSENPKMRGTFSNKDG